MAGLQGLGGVRQQGMNLRDLAYVIFRRRWVILAVMLPIIAVASLGLFKDTGSSIAGCKVLIELQAPETPRWNPRTGIDYDRTLSTLMHMAMSAPVARLAAEALQDSLAVITSLDDGAFVRLADKDELARFLQERLDVSPLAESSILRMRLGSRSARLSLMSVAACRDAFLKFAISATKNTHALEYYDDQVQLVRQELDALLTRRAHVVAQAGYGAVEFDLRGISQQLVDMRNYNLKDMLERHYLESKVITMRNGQALDPDYCPSPEKPNLGLTMVGAKDKVEQVRSQITTLLTKYTEDHIEVRRARERLEGARKVLAAEVESFIRSYELEVAALRAKETAMQSQISRLEQTMTTIPELNRQVALFDSEVAAMTKLLQSLQEKRGEVLINSGADERITSIIRLNEPEIETIITEARKWVYFILIVFFGVIFAVIFAIIVDSRDQRLHSPERIEAQLGLPVLAAVSEEGFGRTRP